MSSERIGVTGIIPFNYFGGLNKSVGSSKIRAYALAKMSPNFKIWKHGYKYDNLIFQKVYWYEMANTFTGPKILDICDPDWINGEVDIVSASTHFDAITCSSIELTNYLRNILNIKIVKHIPDRFNFGLFPEPKSGHFGRATKIVWFGFIKNLSELLSPFVNIISDLGLQLTIISDHPYSADDEIINLSPSWVKYDDSTLFDVIKQNDICLNPKSDKAFLKYKSNNKTIISQRLGVPVAKTIEELKALMNAEDRTKQIADNFSNVQVEYDINKTIEEYTSLLKEIKLMDR